MEIWKPVKGFEDFYEVSNYGHIRSLLRGKVLKPQVNSTGYLRVVLSDRNGNKKRFWCIIRYSLLKINVDQNRKYPHTKSR